MMTVELDTSRRDIEMINNYEGRQDENAGVRFRSTERGVDITPDPDPRPDSPSASRIGKLEESRRLLKPTLIIIGVVYIVASTIIMGFLLFTLIGDPLQNNANATDDKNATNEITNCLSPECVHTSSRILSRMDFETEPCEDFYQFACGGWISENADNQVYESVLEELEWNTLNKMKKIIGDPNRPLNGRAEQLVRIYYDSCMDEDGSIKERSQEEIMEVFDAWNLRNDSAWNLQEIMENALAGHFFKVFFGIDLLWKNGDTTVPYLMIRPQSLTLGKQDYLRETRDGRKIEALEVYFKKLASLVGEDKVFPGRAAEMNVEFETEMAKLFVMSQENEEIDIGQLQRDYPFLNWLELFKTILDPANITVTRQTKIVVNPGYLTSLSKLIIEKEGTDEGRRILRNYVGFEALKRMINYLGRDFVNAEEDFSRKVGGKRSKTRWHYCLEKVIHHLNTPWNSIMIREVLDPESRAQVTALWKNIKESLLVRLSELTWMDKGTLVNVTEIADKFGALIGSPDDLTNSTVIDELYDSLCLNETRFLRNAMQLKRRIFLDDLYQDREELRERKDFGRGIAWASSLRHEIFIPPLILQTPFYDKSILGWLNFGAIGFTMGKLSAEMLGKKGRESKWWSGGSESAFEKKADCFLAQYSNYTIANETVNEILADNGGLRAAFRAHQKWLETRDGIGLLPGLNMTHEQLFFIRFAQTKCNRHDAEYLRDGKISSFPERTRVRGALSNFEDFSEAFKCSPTSSMNPKEKCELW